MLSSAISAQGSHSEVIHTLAVLPRHLREVVGPMVKFTRPKARDGTRLDDDEWSFSTYKDLIAEGKGKERTNTYRPLMPLVS